MLCEPVQQTIEGCLYYETASDNKSQCLVCKEEYNLKKTPRNQATPEDGLVNTECLLTTDKNCDAYDGNNKCRGCDASSGFWLENDACVPKADLDTKCAV